MVDENKTSGLAPPIFQRVLRSNVFHTFILFLVLGDAITAASLRFDHHTKNPQDKLDGFYYAEVYLCVFVHLTHLIIFLEIFLYICWKCLYVCIVKLIIMPLSALMEYLIIDGISNYSACVTSLSQNKFIELKWNWMKYITESVKLIW